MIMENNELLRTKLWLMVFESDYALAHSDEKSQEQYKAFVRNVLSKECISLLQECTHISELRSKVMGMQQLFINDESIEHEVAQSIIDVTENIIHLIDESVSVAEKSTNMDKPKTDMKPEGSEVDPDDEIEI